MVLLYDRRVVGVAAPYSVQIKEKVHVKRILIFSYWALALVLAIVAHIQHT